MISRPLNGGSADACTRSTWPASIPGREWLGDRCQERASASSFSQARTVPARRPSRESFCPTKRTAPRSNADLIAAGLSPFNPEVVAMRAGRLMLELIDEHVSRGDSFAFETTLAGKSYARHIPNWQAAGYHVTLLFLALPSAEAALQRVRERVAQGVPEQRDGTRASRGGCACDPTTGSSCSSA